MAAITLGVLAVAGTVASYNQQRKAAKAQARANAAEQRRADIANARERRAAVRNARVARASIESQGALSGLDGSSSVAASMSNVTSETGSNISFLDQNIQLSSEASQANQQAADYMSRAQGYADLTALANKASGTYGG